MSQFRSEEMCLVQLFIQSEAAHATLQELGKGGSIQFKDLNSDKSAFQRLFVQDVRRCDDMSRILRLLKGMTESEKMKPRPNNEVEVEHLHELHDQLVDMEKELKDHTGSMQQLLRQKIELEEHRHVLREGAQWFQQAYSRGVSFTAPQTDPDQGVELTGMEEGITAGAPRAGSVLGHIAGCIPTANIFDMSQTLFRATRGNMLLKHEEINAPMYDPTKPEEEVAKSVFVIFFSGERSRIKIDKIVDSYGATKYRLPEQVPQQDEIVKQVDERLKDLSMVLEKTRDYRRGKLENILDNIDPWMLHVQREKAVFHTLNMFNYDVTHKCLIAEGWCPTADMDNVRDALRQGTIRSGATVQTVLNVVKTRETPPTFFRNAKIAQGTQSIVDAYGMARYQEFNPAVFSVITFPFLFGVMFGDIGHGFMMAMTGVLLVLYEKKLEHLANDEMFGTLYKGRYNILLMGIFATYSGFIYNELFAVPLEIFGDTAWCSGELDHSNSCLDPNSAAMGVNVTTSLQKWMRRDIESAYHDGTSTGKEVVWEVYPFGTDPGWAHTANKLNSVNSFKMKFAICAGVVQMVAGVCCKLMNTLYFKDDLTMYFVYIPEMIFINSIFGYLVLLILIKWTTNWDTMFILNNEQVVSIPQRYCMFSDDHKAITNLPCWTPPFEYDRAHVAGGFWDRLPEHMWCMKGETPTAGCAVMEWGSKDAKRMIVESNVFGDNTVQNLETFTGDNCKNDINFCSLWKQSPPSLLDSLIKMFMEIGFVPVENQIIAGQGGLQVFLIFIAFVSVPTLLFPKPLLLKKRHEATQHQQLHDDHDSDDGAHGGGGGHGGHGEFEFGEEMVHQMIHTIEYVLGCISNTASYLRLWALSLAHAQLSEVFWEKTVVEIGLESGGAFMLFVCITAWACFTVGVLMGMESLSAFLHALRLHWVEFMNKFYHGDGYKFIPFSFSNLAAILGEEGV
eukprot:CAMPEP_0181303760 /NCGR_PEP_ID=MMETSP1101-20121128/8742_1 /TAXON_ID=46948 /ORGANISM="Rhodomonas abbreviata, Strain Caron Lab Isolate" /LENGTH=958 /DNA_ID=CAMNT_0023409379 /DNA_START=207 /DNA_END=3083 /DNA_ORIENTATION=-